MTTDLMGALDEMIDTREDEARRLKAARAALGGKPTAERVEPKAKPRRRVAAKKGSRAREALKLVHARPGITPPEVAKAMKAKSPSYAYKVLGDLAATGAITKDGTGYVPAGHGEAAAA